MGLTTGQVIAFGKLGINDVFCLNKIKDFDDDSEKIVDCFFVVVNQTNFNTDYTRYNSISLKDGKLYEFADDTNVYYYYNTKNKLR